MTVCNDRGKVYTNCSHEHNVNQVENKVKKIIPLEFANKEFTVVIQTGYNNNEYSFSNDLEMLLRIFSHFNYKLNYMLT